MIECNNLNEIFESHHVNEAINSLRGLVSSGSEIKLLMSIGFIENIVLKNNGYRIFFNCRREEFDEFNDMYNEYGGQDFNAALFYRIKTNKYFRLLEDIGSGLRKATKSVFRRIQDNLLENILIFVNEFDQTYTLNTENPHFQSIKALLFGKIPDESVIAITDAIGANKPDFLISFFYIQMNIENLF